MATLEVAVAWAEMDVFGHVNNTVHLRWFESARIRYFEQAGVATTIEAGATAWPLLVHSSIDYKAKVVYPDTMFVDARVTKLGNTSFTMRYSASSKAQGKVVAEGESVIVMVDPATGVKVPLPADLRTKIEALEKL